MGPACITKPTLLEMCKNGMNVARLNFSHGSHEEHKRTIELIKEVRDELGLPIAILLDTKGPEYRIMNFKNGSVTLKEGNKFILTTDDIEGDENKVSVNYKNLNNELEIGDTVLLNDGLIKIIVENIVGADIICNIEIGGELSSRKSMSFPNKLIKQTYLSEQDKSDVKFGVENDVDFIACSFVSTAQDLIDMKEYLDKIGAKNIDIIAKIENRSGVDNIEEICEHCDGIMIARGDLGVEIPFEELPSIQKKLITKCRLLGKRVITATEMLESMIHNPRPTRAEISDVANAVYDGSSAIMLSGETAAGKYPAETVKIMSKIAKQTEDNIHYKKRFLSNEFRIKNTVDAISHSICGLAIDVDAKATVICSRSGITARMVSRFRSPVQIIGLTTNQKTYRKLALSFGVIPALCKEFKSIEVLFYTATEVAESTLNLKKGDKIIITGGDTSGRSGNTNLIKIETI